MGFPEKSRIEPAILQELKDFGEAEPRLLYHSLIRYFPQLTEEELKAKTPSGRYKWRILVQRAKRTLLERGEIQGKRRWRITEKGRERAEAEGVPIQLILSWQERREPLPSHQEVKRQLLEIGRILGKYAQEEYQRYDVVWKESELSPRISHVFEVQNRGKVEAALAKLKRAYDTQRSKPFLVVIDEKDPRRVGEALQSYLAGSFHQIGKATTVLSPQEVERIYRALTSVEHHLRRLLAEE